MRTRAKAGSVVDTAVIAACFAVEESQVHTLLDAPTAELVRDFLSSLTLKAQEFDDIKAEKLRSDVELENTVRSNESRVKGLKTSVSKGLREVEELRKQVNEQETAQADLRSELDTLKNSATDSSSEVDALHARISSLESANREALSVLEAKSTSHDKLADELASQHQKILTLRREVSTLEEKNQSIENAASSTKFREQALQQEVHLLKRNNEWHEQELKTRSADHTKFRKEKNARVSELQRANEDANTSLDALKRTEATLRQRLDEVSQKADEAFQKIQQTQENATRAEENFAVELDSARRLADLQKQSADTARARLQDLQSTIDQIKDSAADEIGQLQAEIETERSDKGAAESKLAELELEVERLEARGPAVQMPGSIPGTPSRSTNGFSLGTPGRAGSPAPFTPGASRMKGNLSFTQLFSEYSNMKVDLEAEKRRNTLLSAELDEMIQDLESRGPEQEELRLEKERIEAEFVEMSSMLDSATAERDETRRDMRQWEGQVEGLTREGGILRQQLRDLSAQIKILLVEMQARDQGLQSLDAAGQMQLQMIASGELDDEASNDQTSAGALITQRLLLFKDVSDLQDQNVQLLKLNRGLADRMEGDAAKAREAEQADNLRELEELRERVQRHQDELKSLTTQADSIMRERDMFRRMLSHRGQLPSNADLPSMFGDSVHGATPSTPQRGGTSANVEETPRSKEMADYGKLLKDMQSHFDAYRQEAATDHNTLKQQVDRLAREKGDLQGEVARTSGQASLAQERYEMLQSNYNMLKTENGQLQKRTQSLGETAARQDLRTQQVAEELIEAKSLADGMRTETANLKAERELWRKIEGRLTEDNRLLMDERSRLNKMTADLQNLQNERELADSETRRKLQTRAEALEAEMDSVKKKLEQEVDDSKKAALRREYEQEQSRTRIDDLVKSLSNVREDLIAAKTTRDQLQARVDEMKIELRSAEEKAQVLQPRPTPRAEQPAQNGGAAANNETPLSKEQELAMEVSELKRDLDLARGELESIKSQVEQYKAISQSTEEELQSLNETNDQYREEMDRIVEEKDSKIKELEQRTEDLGSELTQTNAELSDLRTQHEESGVRLEEQKISLEVELVRVRDDCERYLQTAKLHQEDLKAQAEIAQQAQQSYENELVRHANAAKNLQDARAEYNSLRIEVVAIKAEAEAAKVTLARNEESWSDVRERYERELAEVKTGREDLKSQNKLLHGQLESVTAQIATLQQKRTAIDQDSSAEASINSGMENLQEVIKYLRREKEIVDVQFELSTQESKRLRQQLDYTQSQLDETRQKLSEERGEHADKEANAASHDKLLQTINELNLYRESSTTLRQEARHAQAQLTEKITEIEALTAQIEPLRTRIREVENDLETKDGEMRLLQDDRDRWRERTQNIISKYDRVDPAEMESMKTQITDLQAERDQLGAEKQQLQEQSDSLAAQVQQVKDDADKNWQEQKAKFIEQAKARSREQSAKIKDLERELAVAREEKDRVVQDLTQAQQSLETATIARDEAVERADANVQQQAQARQETEEGQVEEGEALGASLANVEALEARLQEAEAKALEESNRASTVVGEVGELQARVTELESQISELQQQLDASNASLAQAQTPGQPAPSADDVEGVEHYEHIKEDLASAQREVEALRAAAATAAVNTIQSTDAAAPPEASGSKAVADQVAEQVAQLRLELEQQHNLSRQQLETEFTTRTNNMKQQLNAKLRDGREKARDEGRQEVILKHSEELQRLKQEHEAAIETLREEHRQVVERLTREGATAREKAEGGGQPAATVTEIPADAAKTVDDVSAVKAEVPAAANQLTITDEIARELVQKNAVIRGILQRNIQSKVAQEANKLKEEHDKVLLDKAEEAKKDREQAVTKAVNMESMKQKAKLGMAEGQTRTAKAKLDVVEEAASETPQRPVGEVWTIAKNAKAAPATPAPLARSAAPATHNSTPAAAQPAPTPVGVAGTPSATAQQDRLQARQDRFGAPSVPVASSASTPQSVGVPPAGSFGQPSFTPKETPNMTAVQQTQVAQSSPASDQSNQPSGRPSTPQSAAPPSADGASATPTTQQAGQPQTAQPPRLQQPAAGTVAAASRSIVPPTGTGIPRGGGGSMLPRGGGIPRGRGGQAGGLAASIHAPLHPVQHGQGFGAQGQRGGVQSGLPRGGGNGGRGGRGGGGRGGAAQAPGQGGGSPGLNAGARQFQPQGQMGQQGQGQGQGNKRPLEGGESGNDEKRQRAGGPGPAA